MEKTTERSVAIIEDEKKLLDLLLFNLRDSFDVAGYTDAESFLRKYKTEKPSVIITDVRLPGMSGLELLPYVKKDAAHLPVIIMTAYASIDQAVAAVKAGAYDYLTKPVKVEDLKKIIQRAIKFTSSINLYAPLFPETTEFITQHPATIEQLNLAARVAEKNVPILILGETGTGKEIISNMIHKASKRKGKFVRINCPAIPGELLESELFGYKKGAFTGAYSDRAGKLKLADKGTLFLDEIGDLPLALQAKLLRVIEEKSFYQVGGNELVHTDLRIIAATNKNLKREIENGEFRADLYYRLAVIPIRIPPLKERPKDIRLIARHFLKIIIENRETSALTIDEPVYTVLERYDWPGNVRELRNIITHMALLSSSNRITLEEIPIEIIDSADTSLRVPESYKELLERKKTVRHEAVAELEILFIRKLMIQSNWNISRASRISKMDRRLLQNMIKKYGIQKPH
ncbi:MAG: sigma-54-dependent Fis family transcriptional regulator [Spirochaetes bacterium]|nr:MAG: sigma-54-dependent Fis family transcriptional regulator [Spirochaetota bacterium]